MILRMYYIHFHKVNDLQNMHSGFSILLHPQFDFSNNLKRCVLWFLGRTEKLAARAIDQKDYLLASTNPQAISYNTGRRPSSNMYFCIKQILVKHLNIIIVQRKCIDLSSTTSFARNHLTRQFKVINIVYLNNFRLFQTCSAAAVDNYIIIKTIQQTRVHVPTVIFF